MLLLIDFKNGFDVKCALIPAIRITNTESKNGILVNEQIILVSQYYTSLLFEISLRGTLDEPDFNQITHNGRVRILQIR